MKISISIRNQDANDWYLKSATHLEYPVVHDVFNGRKLINVLIDRETFNSQLFSRDTHEECRSYSQNSTQLSSCLHNRAVHRPN